MSGLDQLIRLQRWTLDEKRRQATDLELLIERLIQDINKLDELVEREIEASRANLELQRALPGYRNAMKGRRERMDKSLVDLRGELEKLREQIAERRKDQAISDEVGLQQHRRKG